MLWCSGNAPSSHPLMSPPPFPPSLLTPPPLPLPQGTFAPLPGLHLGTVCPAGHYCPPGSSSPSPCGGAHLFCPLASALPTPVSPGHYTLGSSSLPGQAQSSRDAAVRWGQQLCERGFWCLGGERHSCPAGVYGDTMGQASPTCSGPCLAGHFCPTESVSAKQRVCGHEGVYCPPGSAAPSEVRPGHYSVHGGPSMRAAQVGCTTHAFQACCGRERGGRGGWTDVVRPHYLLTIWLGWCGLKKSTKTLLAIFLGVVSGGLPCRQLLCPGGPPPVSPRHVEQRHRSGHILHMDVALGPRMTATYRG